MEAAVIRRRFDFPSHDKGTFVFSFENVSLLPLNALVDFVLGEYQNWKNIFKLKTLLFTNIYVTTLLDLLYSNRQQQLH